MTTVLRVPAVVILLLAGAGRAPQQTVFRATGEGVIVDVSVQDRGRPVTGLSAADFVVLDNGRPQIVADASAETMPLEVILLVDASESLDVYLDYQRGAGPVIRPKIDAGLPAVARMLRQGDRLQLLRFASGVSALRTETDLGPTGPIHARATSLFDSVVAVLMQRTDPALRRVVVVITDGVDTRSVLPYEARARVLDRSDGVVQIVSTSIAQKPIMFPPVMFPPARFEPYAWVLEDIVQRTGGRRFQVAPTEDYGRPLKAALDEFRTRYIVRYVPRDVAKGGWHDLTVTVDGHSYDVRHRRGYWGG